MATYLRVTRARVQNFCCFQDSGEVRIDDLTVLLAENENGKTSFLRALAWFSSADPLDDDDRWSGAPGGTVEIVSLVFEMNGEAAAALGDLGYPAPDFVRITKDSVGDFTVEDAETRDELLPAEDRAERGVKDSRRALIAALGKAKTHESVPPIIDQIKSAEIVVPIGTTVGPALRSAVIPSADGPVGVAIENALDELTRWEEILGGDEGEPDAYGALEDFLPRLIYYIDIDDQVLDEADYTSVAADPSDYRTMLNLAKLVGIDLLSLAGTTAHQRLRLSRKASEVLTKQASLHWEGDPVTFRIQFDESQMTVLVDHKGREQKPSRRSRGLGWFLGFYANFEAESRGDLAGAVLLLDEPGLHLHLKQQPKLVSFLESLTDKNQIIYTTHLPLLIPRQALHRLRLMVGRPNGTVRVENDFHKLKTSADVMQPVRASLGLGVADAISLGRANVILEGLSDTYYIDCMRALCREAGAASLSDDVTLLAAAGAGAKMLPLVSFMVGERTRGIVLLDDDRSGHDARRAIEKSYGDLIPIVFTHESDKKTPSGRAIEDLFVRSSFIELVNESYAPVPGFEEIKANDLPEGTPICEAIKTLFRQRNFGGFEKLRPARQLQLRLLLGEKPPDEQTMRAFSDLFTRMTAALDEAA